MTAQAQSGRGTVGLLGLGAMGSRMARRWLEEGFEVVVWNRTAAAVEPLVQLGARRASTPQEVAQRANWVVGMVRDDDASRQVWLGDDGAVHGLHDGSVAVESSTLTPSWVQEWAGATTERGATVLEAPVVGSRPQAEAGQLVYLLGGDAAVVEACRPWLEVSGGRLQHVGAVGQAALAKLAVNTFFASQVAGMAEILTYLQRAGLDGDACAEWLGSLPIVAPAIAGAMGAILARQFSPMFPVELVAKDLGYFVTTGDEHGARTSVAETVQGLFLEAKEAGGGQDNITGIAKIF